MKIVTVPNKILTTPTKPVEKFDEGLKKLAQDMEKILKNQKDPEGVGLSANQVGVGLRVAIVRINPEAVGAPANLIAIVNPKITKHSEKTVKVDEGCLSIPGKSVLVERFGSVIVEAQDVQGKPLNLKAGGFLARVFQHEIDHLDGKLITDRA